MYRTNKAKLYYLYMLSDGEASAREKWLFTTICKELNIDSEEKESIIKECENTPLDGIFDKIKELVGDPVKENKSFSSFYSIMSFFDDSEDYATILWNLINLGYADKKYTNKEREIVDFLKEHWKVKEDLYQEMIDVAETCLALEQQKKWVENLEESDYKIEKAKQMKNDIKITRDSIKLTLAELKF